MVRVKFLPKKTLRLTLTQVLVANICTADLVGIEEAAVFAESANRGSGKSHISIRCRDDGVYGHSEKTHVLLAISGDYATAHQNS